MKKQIKSLLKKILPPKLRQTLRSIQHFPRNYRTRNFAALPRWLHYHVAKKVVPTKLLSQKYFHFTAVTSLQRYHANFGRYPDFTHPTLFSEKVMKRIHTTCQSSSLYPLLADKYRVREYVAKLLGSEENLIPLIDDFASAQAFVDAYIANPHKYANSVVKVNHGSGQNFFIGQEILTEEEIKKIRVNLEQWLNTPHIGLYEMHYARITPHITVEKRLGNGEALIDYKFHMFKQPDGSFQYMFHYISERFTEKGIAHCYFVNQLEQHYIPTSPSCLEHHRFVEISLTSEQKSILTKMIELSKKLMKDLDYARVDWYDVNGKIYFGEITLTPAAGADLTYLDETLNLQMGNMWHYNP